MCGVIGLYSNQDIIQDLYKGILAIQHRGQDAAGIITYDGRFHTKKGNGLINDIFNDKNIKRLKGPVGIGHTRYPTIGGGSGGDAQPFFANPPFGIVMVHNGNVTNYNELRDLLFKQHRRILISDNDVETILNIFAQELAEVDTAEIKPDDIFAAVKGVYTKVKGSYSVIAYIAEQGLVAFRDPHGIRPLVYGTRQDNSVPSYAVASESVTLDMMGFSNKKNIAPGQVLFIDRDRNIFTRNVLSKTHTPCLFEWVYFARPDSFIDDVNVSRCRINLGRLLAEQIKQADLDIDVVIPVPDSARDAAIEIARALHLQYREALVKNRYIGRTFIMPSDKSRKSSIRQKLNPIASEMANKNVLLVDDSIVRGNTSRAIIEMVRECRANKVFFASCSPPLRHPCVYGIDMQTHTEFIAAQSTIKQIEQKIKADKVIYQSLESLKQAVHMENNNITEYCAACFDGNYPTGDITPELLQKIGAERAAIQENQRRTNL